MKFFTPSRLIYISIFTVLVVSGILLISTSWINPFAQFLYMPPQLKPADVIVVFSSGIGLNCEMERFTKEREDYGLSLLQQHFSRSGKIIFTGGLASKLHPTIAECMARYAEHLGWDKSRIIVEPKARTTYENAIYTYQIMQQNHWHSVLLVTSPTHIRRSVQTMWAYPVHVYPAPVPLAVDRDLWTTHHRLLAWLVFYEYSGLLKYALFHLDTPAPSLLY